MAAACLALGVIGLAVGSSAGVAGAATIKPFYCFVVHITPATAGCGAGAATQISVQLGSGSIPADGKTTTTATATVQDAQGNPVTADTIQFAATPNNVTFSSVTNNLDGTYTVTITAGTTQGPVTIQASDQSVPGLSNTAPSPLNLTAASSVGPAAYVAVSLGSAALVANGTSQTTATATVTDSNGNPVKADTVQFSVPPSESGEVTLSGYVNHGDGTYSITITSTDTAGSAEIIATDTSTKVNGNAVLTLSPGPATQISSSLGTNQIVANGSSTTTVTATVADVHNNPIKGDTIVFTPGSAGVTIGPVKDNLDGTYTAVIRSSTTAESVSITATDTSVGPTNITSKPVVLTETVGPAYSVNVTLGDASIAADGESTTIATATVEDQYGNPVTNDTVSFRASPSSEVSLGAEINNHDGTYTITVGSLKTPDTSPGVTITATDTSVSPSLSGSTVPPLSLTPTLAAASLSVSLSPYQAIFADGASQTFATATVTDSAGHAVSGDPVQFYVNGQAAQAPCQTDSSGKCHITLTAQTAVGQETITAEDLNAGVASTNSAILYFVAPGANIPVLSTPAGGSSSGGSSGGGSSSTGNGSTPAAGAGSVTPQASGPSTAQIKGSLNSTLTPRGAAASIHALLSHDGYSFSFQAPAAGRLTVAWYAGNGKRRRLVGSTTERVAASGPSRSRLRLTRYGKSLLLGAKRVTLTSEVSFVAGGEPTVTRSAKFTVR